MNLFDARTAVDRFAAYIAVRKDAGNALISEKLVGNTREDLYDSFVLYLTYLAFFQPISAEAFLEYQKVSEFVRFVVPDDKYQAAQADEKKIGEILTGVLEDYKEHIKAHDISEPIKAAVSMRKSIVDPQEYYRIHEQLAELAYSYTYCDYKENDSLFFMNFAGIKKFMGISPEQLGPDDLVIHSIFEPYTRFIALHQF